MEEKLIEFQSHWNTLLQNELCVQGSSVLVVLLGGLGYTTRGPLFHYCRKACVGLGLDVLSVDYGFHYPRKEYKKETDFAIVLEESYQIIQKCLNSSYKTVVFVGKSLGTVLQNLLAERLAGYDQLHIYFAPTNKTVESLTKDPCLIVSGTADRLMSEESIEKAKSFLNVNLLRVEGANHPLETEDPLSSIEILKSTVEAVTLFLREHL